MKVNSKIKQIRESEKSSHIMMYSNEELYKEGSWLKKTIQTVLDIIPLFREYQELHILDLGCGVGRNCISIAQHYQDIKCSIECVDILDFAIEKLISNAKQYGVLSSINGIVKPIEEYIIKEDHYDLIIAVSALEHIDSKKSFIKKLIEIELGIRKNGIVCFVINSSIKEYDKTTGYEMPVQFEVNLPTEEVQLILEQVFVNWAVIKSSLQKQQYDIPRTNGLNDLQTSVVSFVARKCTYIT